MSVMEMMYEATIAMLAEMASGVNRNLAIPDRNTTGMNTTTNVMVDTRIGRATSRVPSSAASAGVFPMRA